MLAIIAYIFVIITNYSVITIAIFANQYFLSSSFMFRGFVNLGRMLFITAASLKNNNVVDNLRNVDVETTSVMDDRRDIVVIEKDVEVIINFSVVVLCIIAT